MDNANRNSTMVERRSVDPRLKYVIGRRIRYLINRDIKQRPGLKLIHVANELGITTGAIYQWEIGRTTPGIISLIDLSDYFLAPMEYICCKEFSHLMPEQLALLPDRVVCRPPMSADDEMARSMASGVCL